MKNGCKENSIRRKQRLLEGIDTVANAIKVTLGPAARTVVLEKSWKPIDNQRRRHHSQDIELGEPFANMGAKLIQEVASKTQDNAGDGTSTASIPAQSLCHHGLKNMKSGSSPVELKAGFDRAISTVVDTLKDRAVPVETSETIQRSRLSPQQRRVDRITHRRGRGCRARRGNHRREAKSIETSLDVVEGMEFSKGT